MKYGWSVRNLPLSAIATALTLQFAWAGPLPNAWQINDNLESGGSLLTYIANLSPTQVTAATNSGWRYAVTSRLLTDYGDNGSMYFIFGDGTRRYGLAWDLNGAGELTASLLGGPTITLVADPVASTNYHIHQLTYEPVNGQVIYEVDGQPVASSGGQITTAQADTIVWGGASSAGRSQLNLHRAEFEILSQGVIASYNAGLAGNPAVAPSPTTQGWERDAGATAIPEGPVSPDVVATPLGVSTRAATDVTAAAVTLNAQIAFNGLPTDYWFEYGATTNYGDFTGTNMLTADILSERVSSPLTGLDPAKNHHFRVVASNSNGVVTGGNMSFTSATFSTVSISGLEGKDSGSVAWADYDNDGRLDFILTGFGIGSDLSLLWQNTGQGFSNVTASVVPGLPDGIEGSVAWGDYDNDGGLDLILTGDNESWDPVAQIWRNTGNGFSNVTASVAQGLTGIEFGSAAWGDYDNDGGLDFILTGANASGDSVAQIWRNTASGFTNVTASIAPDLLGAESGTVAWGDYDNDGRLDFLIAGYNYDLDTNISQLWQNTGSGFSNVTDSVAPGLPGVYAGTVAWGDYDNDGYLDFLLTGTPDFFSNASQLWRNTGSGFTNATANVAPGLPGVYEGSVAWGDYDNDGQLDFILTGYDNSDTEISQLWRNLGSRFTNVTATVAPGLPGVGYGSEAWADYDNDGRLDFILTGFGSTNRISQLWRNTTPVTNAPPAAPTGLALTATTNAVMLSWNSAVDDHTPAPGLTYNVRAGTTPDGIDLLAGHVNATNGFRRVPAMGNAYLRHSLPLTGLTNGQTVYWSVQAVDTAFAGGPFATEVSAVSIPRLTIASSDATNAVVSWSPPTFGWRLEETPTISAAAWSNSYSGELNPVSVNTTNNAKLYRLKNQ